MVCKKLITAFALASLTLAVQSCKKNQPADQLVSDTAADSAAALAAAPAEHSHDEMAAAAQAAGPVTSLALSEDAYNFGDIKKGESVEHKYEVTNTGSNPLIISSVKPGCGCTAPDYTKEPIMPGKKGTITLKFDSSNFDGPIQKQAEVFANVEKAPIIISFTGNVVTK